MISENDKNIIYKYVDKKYFDQEKIIKYLSIHDVVGNEIFDYCLKNVESDSHKRRVSTWLDDEYGYKPLPINLFLKRVPFYFFVADYEQQKVGDLHCILSGVHKNDKDDFDIEQVYSILEYMFYIKKIPLEVIFQYIVDQTHYVSQHDMFLHWYHYLQLCEKVGINNLTPSIFISSYNELLEQCLLTPIIYEISDIGVGEIFWRHGSYIEFEGTFPCDENGNPIMKWIGLRVKNAAEITCTCKCSERGRLLVKLAPNTMIYALNIYNSRDEDEDNWYQIYAGPQNMQFDYTAIRNAREQLKFTQKEVAYAIGASVRTYQKWESGETTPDGHYLLRILNWLDLSDVQYVTRYTE